MLTHPTLNLLHDLGLYGMAKGFKERKPPPSDAFADPLIWPSVM
jgi:hypothetical protein